MIRARAKSIYGLFLRFFGHPAAPSARVLPPFEQFNRGRAAMKSGVPGVGLGLAFVRTIVLNHKGKIAFSSAPGDTTFRIRLPRAKEE